MVLLQQAIQASQYFDHVEIIELHHNQKQMLLAAQRFKPPRCWQKWARFITALLLKKRKNYQEPEGGLAEDGIRIHSVRLPGLIAHQEVILGQQGQVYTLRHDTSDRLLYARSATCNCKVLQLKSLVYGLEDIEINPNPQYPC